MRDKYLILAILLVPLLLLGACGPSTQAASAGGGAAPYAQAASPVNGSYATGLTVIGTGTVEADPDIAYLTLGVDLRGQDAATVVADAGGRMEQILAALKAGGVAEDDIRTAGYNLWVEQDYDPQTGRPTGVMKYHVSHTVRVTVRNLDQVGTLLSAAVEAGANVVNEVSFSVAEPEKMASEARQLAIADAQKRAQEMTGALNITLGKVLSVSEGGGWTPAPVYYEAARGALEAPAAVPLPAGSFSVSISVVVVYELP